jgi:hypothetical protein
MGAIEFWFWVFALPIAGAIRLLDWIFKKILRIEDEPSHSIDWDRPDGPHDLGL